MYLSRLELHGFKSFAAQTSLDFHPGITAVVGPNGCGKSNIVDAVRWVIGEQRARILRSDKMESVIFNGTVKRRPLGMAEVVLTIENTRGVLPVEYSEISIGRRLYRSGESEYLLNGVQCRLKDITDLFMDTGMGAGAYSVIELKMIEEILSDNAQDRRRLFEEAAGITKYKMRRGQTLRKLDSTRADLIRLRDIVEEIEKRVRSLKRQAGKATRYQEFETQLRQLELALSRIEFENLGRQRDEVKKELQGVQDTLEGQSAQHGQSEATLEAMRAQLLERETDFSEAQSVLTEHLEVVRTLDSERALKAERLHSANRDLKRSSRELAEAAQKLEALQRTAETLDASRTEAEKAVAIVETALGEATKARDDALEAARRSREHLRQVREDELAVADAAAGRIRELDRLENRKEMTSDERASAVREEAAQRTRVEALQSEVDARHVVLQQRQKDVDDARTAFEYAASQADSLRVRIEAAESALRDAERRYEAAAAEVLLLESLVSSYEDFSEAVQFLASDSEWRVENLRTVADVFTCDERLRPALAAALRDYAGCVVVRNEQEAVNALQRLRDADKGRATFILLDRLSAAKETHPESDGRNSLQRFVGVTDTIYRPLVGALLSRVVLVDRVDSSVINDLQPGWCAVTTGGEWADGTGRVHGGGDTDARTGIGNRIGRREQLQRAVGQRDLIAGEVSTLESELERLRIDLTQANVEQKRAFLADAERAGMESETDHAQYVYEHDSLADRRAQLTSRIQSLDAAISQIEAEFKQLADGVQGERELLQSLQHKREEAEEAFHSTEASSRSALSRYSEIHVQAVEKRHAFDNIVRDIARTEAAIAETEQRSTDLSSRIESLNEQLAKGEEEQLYLRERIAEVNAERPEIESRVGAAKDAMMEARSEISALETNLREMRRAKEEQMRQENVRAVRLAEIETRIEDLVNHIREDYDVDVSEIEVTLDEDLNEESARKEVHRLRDRIRSMGPINALALKEYEEESERLAFMSGQLADLEGAERTLIETITEINTTASNRFMETFADIRSNFLGLFGDLFGSDTTADVVLEDPNDPLESAIEILAKPRGKRPSVIAQLSGGEKTLTAIALLFAIYLVKPSPFCILDEVDAPLDDANIDRFMSLIREFAKSTQFILVTHNKRTMEAADSMYGITMQEQGVSNIVGVTFDEAVEQSQLEESAA